MEQEGVALGQVTRPTAVLLRAVESDILFDSLPRTVTQPFSAAFLLCSPASGNSNVDTVCLVSAGLGEFCDDCAKCDPEMTLSSYGPLGTCRNPEGGERGLGSTRQS